MIKIRVREVERQVRTIETRMPFRYGAAEMLSCPHLHLTVTIEAENGAVARGVAADNLPPSWFDKNPAKMASQQIEDQLQVVDWAAEAASQTEFETPFRCWLRIYEVTQTHARAAALPSLLGGFGPSLLERGILDAVGHLLRQPFHAMLRANVFGVELDAIDPALHGLALADILPPRPLPSIAVRHTVGLSDPIRSRDIAPEDRLQDDLPQSLEEVIGFYDVHYFKIKVGNQFETDVARLEEIARLLDEHLPQREYLCTLDGNEQYSNFEELRLLLVALQTRPSLCRLAESLLFIEQPLARAVALDADQCHDLPALSQQVPIIIDESDDSLDAFARALQLGYSGTSHKNCKNIFKSVANLARIVRAEQETGTRPMLSAEDLTNIGVVALQQDVTVLSTLGITHAERNGHHYFRGLSHLNGEEQHCALMQYPDLYRRQRTFARLDIEEGRIDCAALHQMPGLGTGAKIAV